MRTQLSELDGLGSLHAGGLGRMGGRAAVPWSRLPPCRRSRYSSRHHGPGGHPVGRGTRSSPAPLAPSASWGELEDRVALPCGWVCDVLGIEHDVLAAAVRARIAP